MLFSVGGTFSFGSERVDTYVDASIDDVDFDFVGIVAGVDVDVDVDDVEILVGFGVFCLKALVLSGKYSLMS